MEKATLKLLEDRIKELKTKKSELLAESCKLTKNTTQTQRYQLSRQISSLSIIQELLIANPEAKLSKQSNEALINLIEPHTVGTSIEVIEGDDLIELLTEKYADVKDNYNKAMKAAEKAELILDAKTGKFASK